MHHHRAEHWVIVRGTARVLQADHLSAFRQARQLNPASREVVHALIGRADPVSFERIPALHSVTNGTEAVPSSGAKSVEPAVDPTADLAQCFLRLANLPSYPLDRLSRYEGILWRQAGQILFALDALDRRKPQARGRRFRIGNRQYLPPDGRDDY